EGNPIPLDDEAWARSLKNHLMVDCVPDAKANAARVIRAVDAFDEDGLRQLWRQDRRRRGRGR
ncbi:MAG: hypothetical protein RLZZ299_907, partial [Pseudomonadota bacterium]